MAEESPQAQRERRLVEQAASLAIGLVIAALRSGAEKSLAKDPRNGRQAADVIIPWADTLDGLSGGLVDRVHRQVLGSGRRG